MAEEDRGEAKKRDALRESKGFRNTSIPFEPVEITASDGVPLYLYRMPKEGPPILLLHGGSAQHDSFCLPRHGRSLAEFLWEEGYEPWLLDWRASFRITERLGGRLQKERTKLSLDAAAQHDIPTAIEKIRKTRDGVTVHALGHCLGAAVLAQSIAAGHLCALPLGRVVLLTLGLFYQPPFSGKLKSSFEVLERLWHDAHLSVVDPRFPRDEKKWPRKLREVYKLLGRGAGPHRYQKADPDSCEALCDRISFMYGAPYVEELLAPEIHGEWTLEFSKGEKMPVPGDRLRLPTTIDRQGLCVGQVIGVDATPSWDDETASGTITVTGLPGRIGKNGEFKVPVAKRGTLTLEATGDVVAQLDKVRTSMDPELPRQFGAIPLLMYLQGAQNVRRGRANYLLGSERLEHDHKLCDERSLLTEPGARRAFESLEAVTLITGSRNTLWHRSSIDRMYAWLTNGPGQPLEKVNRRIIKGYGHQDLMWGKRSREDVFPTILNDGLGGPARSPR